MGSDELAGRAHLQPGVRVVGVVVLEPGREQLEGSGGVRQRGDLDVVALERADEGLGDAIALRARHRRKIGLEAELAGEDAGVLGGVGRAVVS